jgi:hypothetical protein
MLLLLLLLLHDAGNWTTWHMTRMAHDTHGT